MCITCDHNPCLRSCPEAYGTSSAIGICQLCADYIFEYEEYRLIDYKPVHEECLEEMRGNAVAEMLGIKIEIN